MPNQEAADVRTELHVELTVKTVTQQSQTGQGGKFVNRRIQFSWLLIQN